MIFFAWGYVTNRHLIPDTCPGLFHTRQESSIVHVYESWAAGFKAKARFEFQVEPCQLLGHGFCAGQTPGSSVTSLVLFDPLQINLCSRQSSLTALRSSSLSLRQRRALLHSWNITLLCGEFLPLGLNRTILVSAFDLEPTYLPFEEPLLCAAPMSTIAPLETAAAACSASSYLWLHAAWVELARDRSSHSGRRSLTGDSAGIWLELKASHSVRPSIQIKKIKWVVWLQGSSMYQYAWDWNVPIREEAQICSLMQDTFSLCSFFFLSIMYWMTSFGDWKGWLSQD